MSDDAEEIEIIVIQGFNSVPKSKESSNETTDQSSSSSQNKKQPDKLKAEAKEDRLERRLAKASKLRHASNASAPYDATGPRSGLAQPG